MSYYNSMKKKHFHRNYKILTFLIVLVVFLTGTIIFLNVDRPIAEIVKVSLVGSESQELLINSTYVEEGVKVTINEKEVDIKDVDYSIDNNVNMDELGEYTVKYHVSYNDQDYDITRNVTVVDNEKPEIVILTSKVSEKGEVNNLRYYAIDNYDGIITDKVSVIKEEGRYRLTVSDSSKNETVEYVDISDAINDYILELNGTVIQYVEKGKEYVDKGIKVTNLDGDELNINYTVDGNVDSNVVGQYKIKYTIDGVDSFQERIVNVYDKVSGTNISNTKEKVIYLTFDDGPGQYTSELLDILGKYNVKATFFVTNQFKKYVPLIEREHQEGHVVAVHTLTHNWNIYRSFESYYKDFNAMNDIIAKYTGEKSKIFRFPGGGSNTISKSKSLGVMSYNVSKMNELGYIYYDWNVDSEDAAGAKRDKIVKNVINGINNRNYSVVLMHDIKRPTIDAIEEIIVYGLDNGYTFDVLSTNTPTVHHHVNN